MSESKTARASAVKTVKEKHVETTEEAIKAIRDNLAGGLHIGDMSRVRKLLAAYDEALGRVAHQYLPAGRQEHSEIMAAIGHSGE